MSANRAEIQPLRSASEPAPYGRRRQKYWIALPAYNEEQSLPPLLDRIAEAMVEADLPYTVIVVNDGSKDGTARVASEYANRIPLVLENHPVNMGLGATMRDGLLKAIELADPDDIIVTMDADNSHNPESIWRMGRLIREGADVVIASRYQPGSRVRGVPFYREILSLAGRLAFRVTFPIRGVRDYTCGYRAYRAMALQAGVARYGQAMFDQQGFQCIVDILLKLRPLDLTFTEVPMVLRYDLKQGASKMRVARTIKSTLGLMLKRRFGS
jgi:dolichol-phosphate mannosyltransferase